MACNFPGNSENIDQFWTTLKDGIDCVRGITRFDTHSESQFMYTEASMVKDVESFDNDFFGISNSEAPHIDPHQRLLLTVGFEALYDSLSENDKTKAKQSLMNSMTGVFIGMGPTEWEIIRNCQVPSRQLDYLRQLNQIVYHIL